MDGTKKYDLTVLLVDGMSAYSLTMQLVAKQGYNSPEYTALLDKAVAIQLKLRDDIITLMGGEK
jgi:hypothetical protein